MKDYLESYKYYSKEENEKLLNYSIDKINIESKNIFNSEFSFTVKFSVQPVSSESVWIAGNGILGNSGWINNKYKEVTVVKRNGRYTVKTIGVE